MSGFSKNAEICKHLGIYRYIGGNATRKQTECLFENRYNYIIDPAN